MAGKRAGRFELESARRIARQTRRMEGAPLPADVPQTAPILEVPFLFRRFTLKEALGADGATAYLVKYDSDEEKYVADTDIEFTVRDPTATLHGVAYDADNEDLMVVGWAIKPFDCPEWEIVYLPEYQLCTAEPTGAVKSGDGSFTVDTVAPVFGANPVTAATDTLTVHNIYEDDIDAAVTITIVYNATEERWEVANIICPA